MKHEVRAETGSLLIKEVRREIGASQAEVARRTWFDAAMIARIELGREPCLPTLRRLLAALGGRLELAAHFERPLEMIAEDFLETRLEARLERERRQHERNVARWASRPPA